MLTSQEREFIRQAQAIEYHSDYTKFEEFVDRISNNQSLTDGETEELEELTNKYNWEINK